MERLTFLNPVQKRKNVIGVFGGLNVTETIQDNEFQEMQNLSSDEYPAAACRKPRSEAMKTLEHPHGMYWKNGLLLIDGTDLIYEDEIVGQVADSDKLLCGMGAYVVIWPDKKVFNTDLHLLPQNPALRQPFPPTSPPVDRSIRRFFSPYWFPSAC